MTERIVSAEWATEGVIPQGVEPPRNLWDRLLIRFGVRQPQQRFLNLFQLNMSAAVFRTDAGRSATVPVCNELLSDSVLTMDGVLAECRRLAEDDLGIPHASVA